MIESKNELHYLYLNFRTFISFNIKKIFFWLFNGHLIKKGKIKKYIQKNKKKKLHLGSTKNLDGFLNSQILGQVPIDITNTLPFSSNSFDIIFSSHLLEHIHKNQIEFFLMDSFRVLKNGGLNIIATPSLEKIFKICYTKNKNKLVFKDFSRRFYKDKFICNSHIINLSFRAFGHRFIVDSEYIKKLSIDIGYSNTKEIKINQIPDQTIKNYIKKYKPIRWQLETSIFVLRK